MTEPELCSHGGAAEGHQGWGWMLELLRTVARQMEEGTEALPRRDRAVPGCAEVCS